MGTVNVGGALAINWSKNVHSINWSVKNENNLKSFYLV